MRLMKQKKYYQHPVLHSIILPPAQMICMSDVSQDEHELITVDLKGIEDWQPDSDEQVLIAHGSAKFMKNEGVELGYFAGKVHFVAQEQTQQSLICCVTTKRIVFIPESNKRISKNVFSIGCHLMGVDWINKMIAERELFKDWLDKPLEIKRNYIKSAELSPHPVGNIVIIHLKQGDIFVGTDDLGWSLDIHQGIINPKIFIE